MQMKQEMVNRITNNVLRKVLKDEYNQNIIENLYELFELSNEAILPNKEEVRNRISFLPKKFEVTLDNLIYIRKTLEAILLLEINEDSASKTLLQLGRLYQAIEAISPISGVKKIKLKDRRVSFIYKLHKMLEKEATNKEILKLLNLLF